MTFPDRFVCAPDALVFDPQAQTLTLDSAKSYDVCATGLAVAPGSDRGQPSRGAGWCIADDGHVSLRAPDGTGVTLFCVKRNGNLCGYLVPETMAPGAPLKVVSGWNGHEAAGGRTRPAPGPAFFGPGTMIRTEEGPVPVEWLETSDRVLTRDNGYQPILWIDRTKADPGVLRQNPDLALVTVPAGSVAPGVPAHDLRVTGGLRIILRGVGDGAADRLNEVLAPVQAWRDCGVAAPVRPARSCPMTRILCANHEIILAEGTWVETFCADADTYDQIAEGKQNSLSQLLGPHLHNGRTARPWIDRSQAGRMITKARNAFQAFDESA